MSNNIYDTANQLERDLREYPAYKELKEAYEDIKADDEANELFNRFRDASMAIQEKQMQGQQPSEEDISQLQAMSGEVMENELIMKLMQSEEKISQLINDINKIITRPLSEIYE